MGKLNCVQNRKVQDWVLGEWADIEEHRPNYAMVAHAATEALQFPVRRGNIRGAVIALGKTWPNGSGKEPKNAAERELLLAMASVVEMSTLVYQDPPVSIDDVDALQRAERFQKALADIQ